MKKTTKKRKAANPLVEYIGWIGVFLLLGNYILLSSGILRGDGVAYHIGALVGSLAIGSEAWLKRDRQPAILNFIFVGVAVYAIVRIVST